MPDGRDITEVAVLSKDGRTSRLATFHGWQKRDDQWFGDCKVFQAEGGQRWENVPSDRIVPLVYCSHNPITGETFHSDGCRTVD